jgi:hypothetical protein
MKINSLIKEKLHVIDVVEIEENLNIVASKLMNEYQFVIGNNNYKFTEIEFYFHSKIHKHEDTYCHKHDNQLNFNKWYFHGSGLDLAFGNEERDNKEKAVYFGILIRGIKNISKGKYISGPLNVVQELFDKTGEITSKEIRFYIEETETSLPFEIPIKSTRINLPKKDDVYFDNKYRFLTDINPKHQFAEKTKVANAMLFQGYTKDAINKLFNYKIISN